MRRLHVLMLMLAIVVSGTLHAYGPDVIGAVTSLFTSETINPSSSATSSSWTKLGNTKVQSAQLVVSGTGGAPNVLLEVQGSYDNTNFYYPTVGASITTVTANGGVIVPVETPVVPYQRFKLYNLSSTVTATCSLAVLSQ